MQNFTYEEQIKVVEDLIEKKDFKQAREILEEELRMPYIPLKVEEVFRRLWREVQQLSKPDLSVQTIHDEDSLRSLLVQDDEAQLKLLDALSRLNLRQYESLMQDVLNHLSDPLLKRLAIRLLIEQSISTEYTMEDDMSYQFIPAALTLPEDSEAVQKAYQLLCDWFENDNPSLLKLCTMRLNELALMALPLGFEAEEAFGLALECARELIQQIGSEEEIEAWNEKITEFSTH